ncbi:rCG63405, isoform CRA_a [Rattus norvegicus]|uniref:RCG63405, isoform CRA_a n=1 Tax=Rattus norvegicus TaxID=10116 RepID=A6II51_RAT|nr:rCG63405, isoform CRA_a [Rattus norvegicus]
MRIRESGHTVYIYYCSWASTVLWVPNLHLSTQSIMFYANLCDFPRVGK